MTHTNTAMLIGLLWLSPVTVHGAEPEPRDPIIIIGDEEFTPENGVRSGSGTEEDPYIISDWLIKPEERGVGVRIVGTRQHFILRNLTIEGKNQSGVGVRLEDVRHGILETSLVEQLQGGAELSDKSAANVLRDSAFVNNATGVRIEGGSFKNVVKSNLISRSLRGLSFSAGVRLTGVGGDNSVVNNTIVGRGDGIGVRILNAEPGNRIEGNSLDQHKIGIQIDSPSQIVRGNLVEHNSTDPANVFNEGVGIDVTTDGNLLEDNKVGFSEVGIRFVRFSIGLENVVSETFWTDGEQSIDGGPGNYVCDAGSDREGSAGEPVAFEDVAVHSADPVSAPAEKYRWEWGDGESSEFTRTDPQRLRPAHTYDAPGAYTARLTVSYEMGFELSDEVIVDVR